MTRYAVVAGPVPGNAEVFLLYAPAVDRWTQAVGEDEIELMGRDLIACMLRVPVDEVEVDVQRRSMWDDESD